MRQAKGEQVKSEHEQLGAKIQSGIDAEIKAEITRCEEYLKSPIPFLGLDPLTPGKVSDWCNRYLNHGGAEPYYKGAMEFWEWARDFMNDNESFLIDLIKAATILK